MPIAKPFSMKESEFKLSDKEFVEQVLQAAGLRKDQDLMGQSISNYDNIIHLKDGEKYIDLILVSLSLQCFCYYE